MCKPWYLCSNLCYLSRTICRETKSKFSTRWSSHRSNWNRPNCEIDENNKDKVALLQHVSEFHGNVNKPPIHEAYIITFVEANSLSLDFCEDKWYHKLNAQINIQSMILPPVWYSFCFSAAERRCISVLQTVVVFHISRPVCRDFCLRQSELFHHARRDLVATTPKMHIYWIITLNVSSYLRSLALQIVTFTR